ncbi:hypothetical protein J2Z33_003333, partial [Rubellimicrobium aerolatum]|nr:hypothetical protein [Rubellimicrobium aerolatum]
HRALLAFFGSKYPGGRLRRRRGAEPPSAVDAGAQTRW